MQTRRGFVKSTAAVAAGAAMVAGTAAAAAGAVPSQEESAKRAIKHHLNEIG